MKYRECKSATDIRGNKIRVGSVVLYVGYGEVIDASPFPVKVISIHAQGADGTILHTEPAPQPDYPHHFSCRASVVELVK